MLDQAFFDGHRATGQNEVLQGVWIYEHAIDFDGLKRIHHNLGYGLLGRRIERSPLPFGRHRWVADRGPSDIDIVDRALSLIHISTLGHVCGTCRFGTDPKTSVLDPQNRTHEVDNLYVVDASFFPSSTGLNPSLTVAANALRVAAHVNQAHFAA